MPLQGARVAAQAVVIDVEFLEVLVPLRDLFVDGVTSAGIIHCAHVYTGHLLHLQVLRTDLYLLHLQVLRANPYLLHLQVLRANHYLLHLQVLRINLYLFIFMFYDLYLFHLQVQSNNKAL